MVSAGDVPISIEWPDDDRQMNGNTGFGQRGFDDQLLLGNTDSPTTRSGGHQKTGASGRGVLIQIGADLTGVDDHPSAAAAGHTIHTVSDAKLGAYQEPFLVDTQGRIFESGVKKDGPFKNKSSVGISNHQVSLDLSIPSGNWAIPNLEILELEEFAFNPFDVGSSLIRHGSGSELFPIRTRSRIG